MGKNIKKSSKKRGNAFGFFFFKILIRILGIKTAYSYLYIVCFYYLLFDRQAVRNALPYIKRRFPDSEKLITFLHVYRLFISQGKQLIDRYIYLEKPDFFSFELKQNRDLKNLVKNSKNGIILLNSHIGNWQISLGVLNRLNIKKLNILIKPESNKAVENTLNFKSESTTINYISTENEFGGLLEIYNCLKNGEVVSMMGDRNYGAKTIPVKFLNDTAYFPISAFHTAVSANSPIVLLYVVKENIRKYSVYADKVLYPDQKKKKKETINSLLQEYSRELECFTKEYPYQCFIFDDIWKMPS